MNNDLLSREALIERLERNLNACNPNTFSERCFQDAINTVTNFPAVDAVEVVHSRWELVTTKWMPPQLVRVGYCQNCKEERPVDNYCPNCGARMQGGSDE